MQASNPFTAELVITPQPSRLLLIFIVLTHLSALVAVLLLPGLAFWWRFALVLSTLLSLGYYGYWHSDLWLERKVKKLYWREFGGWELTTDNGQHLPVILQANSFNHLYCSILNFKTREALGSKAYTIILLPDNCGSETRRLLRIRIKLLQLASKK